jgi:hypothetical protein
VSPTMAQNVLDLDGGQLELPPNLIADWDEFTFEGWVKWSRFNAWSMFFIFGQWGTNRTGIQWGVNRTEITVGIIGASDTLQLTFDSFVDANWFGRAVESTNKLPAGEWVHIAAASTRSNMWLYVNGALAGMIPDRGLASLKGDPVNLIGANDFNGQVAELRLWNRLRTEAQIRENRFKRLTGTEPGLVGNWTFEDPANPGKDFSPGGHDGKLVGKARVTVASPALTPASSGGCNTSCNSMAVRVLWTSVRTASGWGRNSPRKRGFCPRQRLTMITMRFLAVKAPPSFDLPAYGFTGELACTMELGTGWRGFRAPPPTAS